MNALINEMLRFALSGSLVGSILLKITTTTVLALALTRFAQRSRAALRHAILTAAFVLLLVLPIASLFVPTVRVVVPIAVQHETARSSFGLVQTAPGNTTTDGTVHFSPSSTEEPTFSLTTWLFLIWLTGFILFILPVIAGLWQTRSLRRSAVQWPDSKSIFDHLSAEAGIRRHVNVLLHDAVPGP